MYHSYFGLNENPFSIAVNPRYLFMSSRHRDALAHLLYGISAGGGFIMLTGPVGTGKTTTIRCLLEQLPQNTDIALVLNPALDAKELLATVCDELAIMYEDEHSLKKLTDSLHRILLDNFAKGRKTVLLIDEAQHLKFDVLEQIRLMTNLETNTQKLLQIILVGQPELKDLLARPELSQLSQRITARYELSELNLAETEAYIQHRLRVAGAPASVVLFKPKVVAYIYKVSRGVPRIINVLCDRMLLGAYGAGKTEVDMPVAQQAAKEVIGNSAANFSFDQVKPLPGKPLLWIGLPLLIAACLVGFGLWQLYFQTDDNVNVEEAAVVKSNVRKNVVEKNVAVQEHQINQVSAVIKPQQALTDAVDNVLNVESKQRAITTLGSYLGFENISCFGGDLRCEKMQLKSWQELESYNRPAVISLLSEAKIQSYLVVLGIEGRYAFVGGDGRYIRVPLMEIGKQWTGETVVLWRAPADYVGALQVGQEGRAVAWLAERFAKLDHQTEPLTKNKFTPLLKQRVRMFQQNYNLQQDGIAGLQTLLKLQEQTENLPTLRSPHLAKLKQLKREE